MRAVIQRVKKANVSVSEKTVGKCGVGALILVCAMKNDSLIVPGKNFQAKLFQFAFKSW
jgi:D-Tyr-tRNAtyr deacylase